MGKRKSVDESNGEVAYLQITQVQGNAYGYTNAAADDVLLRPDLLPINTENDLDDTGNTITIENYYLDFSDDAYANVKLDANTTVDVDDYVLLYTGIFGNSDVTVSGYGRITYVNAGDSTTTITYIPCTWDAVQSAMDLRTEQDVDGEALLADVDREAVERSIAQQAQESGFAQEAANYLVAVATDEELVAALPGGVGLSDVKITMADGTVVSAAEYQRLAAGSKPKVTINKLAVTLDSKLQHFKGYSGVRMTLEIGVSITFNIRKSTDAQMTLKVSGKFEQELRLAMDVRGEAVWNSWGAFPYIEEYRMVAAVDIFQYSGVSFDVAVTTKEKKENGRWTENPQVDEFLKDVKTALRYKKMLTGNSKLNIADELTDKYAALLSSNSEYITLVDQVMFGFETKLPPCFPIIAVDMTASFVVKLDASAAMGIDYYYICGERYVFCLDVYARTLSSDVIQIQEETSEFTAYALGRLALRMGVNLEFLIGIWDTDYISAGIEAEAGAYAKVYGYFYYQRKENESQGVSSSKYGTMLIEIGGYAEVYWKTNVFKELCASEITIYENETPLWYIGEPDDVLDFETKQTEMPQIQMKGDHQTAGLGDDLFSMRYMNLRDGSVSTAVYDDSADFTITISNDKFTYDPVNNTVVVNPAQGDVELDATMTITWKRAPLTFTSQPIQRTVSLHWDNLHDGYLIIPYTNGGSYIPVISGKYQQEVVKPADPVKTGYVFTGWYRDEACTQPYTFPATMPSEDANIFAGWTPARDTIYQVAYYQQNLGASTYSLVEKAQFTGTTGSIVTPAPKTYEGFITPTAQELTILADGSAVLCYYYDRIVSTLTFDPGIVGGEPVGYLLQYGAVVYAPQMGAAGYDFQGYDKPVPARMGAGSATYTAQWKISAVSFRVEYYVQQPDGRYVLQEQLYTAALTGAELTEDMLLDQWLLDSGKTAAETYLQPDAVVFDSITQNGKNLTANGEAAIAEDNGVIKVRFARVKHTVTFDLNNGQQPTVLMLYSGAAVNAPKLPQYKGYSFAGWEPAMPETVGTEDLTLKALWTANAYTVTFCSLPGVVLRSEVLTYGAALTAPEVPAREGYGFSGWDQEIPDSVPAEDLVINACWTPVSYTITYSGMEGATHDNPASYHIESEDIHFADPVKAGYLFLGWQENGQKISGIATGSTGDRRLEATWMPISYTVILHANNGTNETEELQCRYDSEQALPANGFRDNGYAFAGWTANMQGAAEYTDGQSIRNLASQEGAVVHLYGVWTPVDYQIVYVMDGGVNAAQNPVSFNVENNQITLRDPIGAPQGKHFDGWYADAALTRRIEGNYTITSVAAFYVYAKWAWNSYIIIFDDNLKESTAADGSQLMVCNTAAALKSIDTMGFANPGYSFAGWATSPTGEIAYANCAVVDFRQMEENSALRLYAVWKPNTYQVAFQGGTGVVNVPEGFSFNIQDGVRSLEAYVPAMAPGYRFAGWYDEEDCSGEAVTAIAAGSYGDKVLYAKAECVEYEIVYHYANSQLVGDYTTAYTVESTVTLPSARYDEYGDYQTFVGWYEDAELSKPFQNDLATNPRKLDLYAKWDLCTVIAGTRAMDNTPWSLTGRVILDWSKVKNCNFADHTGRSGVPDGRYNNIDLVNAKEVIFIGASNKTYTNVMMHLCLYEAGESVTVRFQDFNVVSDGALINLYESSGFTLNITAKGTNKLKPSAPGGTVINTADANLRISGDGVLDVVGGTGGAGGAKGDTNVGTTNNPKDGDPGDKGKDGTVG